MFVTDLDVLGEQRRFVRGRSFRVFVPTINARHNGRRTMRGSQPLGLVCRSLSVSFFGHIFLWFEFSPVSAPEVATLGRSLTRAAILREPSRKLYTRCLPWLPSPQPCGVVCAVLLPVLCQD